MECASTVWRRDPCAWNGVDADERALQRLLAVAQAVEAQAAARSRQRRASHHRVDSPAVHRSAPSTPDRHARTSVHDREMLSGLAHQPREKRLHANHRATPLSGTPPGHETGPPLLRRAAHRAPVHVVHERHGRRPELGPRNLTLRAQRDRVGLPHRHHRR